MPVDFQQSTLARLLRQNLTSKDKVCTQHSQPYSCYARPVCQAIQLCVSWLGIPPPHASCAVTIYLPPERSSQMAQSYRGYMNPIPQPTQATTHFKKWPEQKIEIKCVCFNGGKLHLIGCFYNIKGVKMSSNLPWTNLSIPSVICCLFI